MMNRFSRFHHLKSSLKFVCNRFSTTSRSPSVIFSSDNCAIVDRRLLSAIQKCNDELKVAPSYGDDIVTSRTIQLFKQKFGNIVIVAC
jgi:hypothetical protein